MNRSIGQGIQDANFHRGQKKSDLSRTSRSLAGVLLMLSGLTCLGLTSGDPGNPSMISMAACLLAWIAAVYTFSGIRKKALAYTLGFMAFTGLFAVLALFFTRGIFRFPVSFLIQGGLGLILAAIALSLLKPKVEDVAEKIKFLETLTNILNKILMIAGGVAVLALMTLATGNVVLRVFHFPFRGAYEIVSFLGAIVIAFALGYTQRKKDHIVVEILTERFPKKLQRGIDTLAFLIITIFFAVVSWQIFVWGMKIYVSHEVSETLKVIYHPFVFAVAVAFAVVALTALVDFLKNIFAPGEE